MGYKYKIVELSLARVFKVRDTDLPAFRARIRHLRNIGVPAIDKPGTGQKVDYSRVHILQLLFALEAELMGLPAEQAASFSQFALSELLPKIERAAKEADDYFLKRTPSFSFDTSSISLISSDLPPQIWMIEGHRSSSVNIAVSVRKLDEELHNLAPDD